MERPYSWPFKSQEEEATSPTLWRWDNHASKEDKEEGANVHVVQYRKEEVRGSRREEIERRNLQPSRTEEEPGDSRAGDEPCEGMPGGH